MRYAYAYFDKDRTKILAGIRAEPAEYLRGRVENFDMRQLWTREIRQGEHEHEVLEKLLRMVQRFVKIEGPIYASISVPKE